MRIFYRYLVREFLGLSNPTATQVLEGAFLEEQQSKLPPEFAASVYEITPYLASRPVYHPPPVLTDRENHYQIAPVTF